MPEPSARDRLEAVLDRLAARADEERVFTRIYTERARAEADAADARRTLGVSLGPLDGVIVSIKDLFDVAGETTLAGSRILADKPPATADATVVARLRRGGAVIVGKTAMSEFAFTGLGLNPHTGTPGNAADPRRVPGGSSAGAGVAAAEGTCAIAIGTDTGGSVRIPASLNGIVGFKPTARRVPTAGAFPLSYALDSIGPLAGSVAECAAADAVMAGEEPGPLAPRPIAGLRIGVPRGRLFGETEDIVAQGFECSLALLSAAGARIVEHGIEDLLDAMVEASQPASIAAMEAAAVHAEWLTSRAADFDPNVHARILIGAAAPASAYVRAVRRRAELVAAMDARLAEIDLLALPATATTAPEIAPLEADARAFSHANLLMLRNTSMGNFFDLTGISLPMPRMTRPAGLMLLARHGEDRRLLALAASVERVLR